AIQPVWASVNRTALSCSAVPLVWALHDAPASVERSTAPPAPTAIRLSPPRSATAFSAGVPLLTASGHVPPLLVRRQAFPLSPTPTMVSPSAATPRSDLSPSAMLVQLAPPSKER